VAARPGWIHAAWILCIAAGAAAQPDRPLDLRLPKKLDEGVVRSIRELYAAPESTPSLRGMGPLVGAVIYLPFGEARGDEEWRFGAAGTPEMRARLGETSYEIAVVMDDGERRSFRRRETGRFFVGQRVTLRSGELEPLRDGNKPF
jgi:hypothetical protein